MGGLRLHFRAKAKEESRSPTCVRYEICTHLCYGATEIESKESKREQERVREAIQSVSQSARENRETGWFFWLCSSTLDIYSFKFYCTKKLTRVLKKVS